jgi:hypothetical protein
MPTIESTAVAKRFGSALALALVLALAQIQASVAAAHATAATARTPSRTRPLRDPARAQPRGRLRARGPQVGTASRRRLTMDTPRATSAITRTPPARAPIITDPVVHAPDPPRARGLRRSRGHRPAVHLRTIATRGRNSARGLPRHPWTGRRAESIGGRGANWRASKQCSSDRGNDSRRVVTSGRDRGAGHAGW